jgi:hypothetical protein
MKVIKIIQTVLLAIITILILPVMLIMGGGPIVIKDNGSKKNPLFKTTILFLWLVTICNIIHKAI